MAGCCVVVLSAIFAVLAIAFLFIAFVVFLMFILALVLLIIGIINKKKGKKSGKILLIISSILLLICITICGLFVFWQMSLESGMTENIEESFDEYALYSTFSNVQIS